MKNLYTLNVRKQTCVISVSNTELGSQVNTHPIVRRFFFNFCSLGNVSNAL